MKRILTNGLAVLVLAAATMSPVWGQKSGGGNTPSPTPNPTPTPTPTPTPNPTPTPFPTRPTPTPTYPRTPDNSLYQRIFTGRVVLDTGTAPPESVAVQEVCSGRVRAKTFTDSRGYFSLELSKQAQMGQMFDASEDYDRRSQPEVGPNCELRAVLAGYRSSETHLERWTSSIGATNVGNIVLQSISGTPIGTSISVTSLQVPPNARKEYDKALSDISNNNLKKAEQRLQKATEIYPKYAAAWVKLGQLSEEEKDNAKAREAYSQAIAADSHYLPPYIHMAFLDASEKKWDEVLSETAKAIAIDPTNFYESYFLNAAANSNLKHPEEAMKSALRAAEIDKEHREPRINLLLARLYASKGDREATAAQLRLFVQYAPKSPESTMAQASLKRLEEEKVQK